MTTWWSDSGRDGYDRQRAQRMALRRLGAAMLRDRVFGGLWRFAEVCVLALERLLSKGKAG